MKILIAEDEEFSKQILQGCLERLGHEVTAVSDGEEAWQILKSEEFPLVVTDWMMPGADGLELVHRIRSREKAGYTYIIVLTAKSEKKHIVEGILAGADDFLTKPYDTEELRVRLRSGERIIELKEDLTARNVELERVNRRMKNDLEAAARIQRSLLPTTKPESRSVDFAWVFRPCDELAGDIFNVFQVGKEHVALYLLDVVGHGVPAALLSVTLSRFLSPQAGAASVLFSSSDPKCHLLRPSEVADELNRRFPMKDQHGQFFTLWFGILDLSSRELHYVSAGHPGPVIAPLVGSPVVLETPGFMIGVTDDPEYEDQTIALSPGDRIFLYSDGLVEAQNPSNESFGTERIVQIVANEQSLQRSVHLLDETVLRWCSGEPDDDISVLAMHIMGQSD